MAKYIKNDINFHGARSKTRVVENPSSNKNKKRDDGWGSVPSSSVNNNSDHGWGEIPSDGAIHKDTWESDRLVYGKSERNRKFRMDNNNSSFRVPIQSVPDWEKADTEFPSLAGSRSDNVWERRKRKQEEVAAIAPSNETEEEMMVRKALELSMKESKMEEERRRQLEEEYRLQMQILEANPDMFEEFRADQNEFPSSAGGFDNHFQKHFPNVEKDDSDKGAWGVSTKKIAKEKPKYKTEDLKDDFPQLKQKSALPSFNGTTTQPKNKVSQAVEMFGGWGTPKPFAQQNAAVAKSKSQSKPSQWETVDTTFVPLPLKKTVVEEEPIVEPQTPPSLEVKLENTTNLDTDDVMCAKSASEAIEPRNSEAIEPRNNLGSRDAVGLNLKDTELGYSLDQKDKEFEAQTKRKRPKAKLGRRIKEKESNLVPEESRTETSALKVDHTTEVKINDSVHEEDRTKTVVQKDQRSDASCDRLSSEHNNQKSNSTEFQSKPKENNAGALSEFGCAKSKIDSLTSEFPESLKAVECDYAFLLNRIDATSTVTSSEDTSLSIKPPVAAENASNSLPEIYQTTFNIDNFFAEASSSEDLPIPEPIPFSIAPPIATNPKSMAANSNPNSSSFNETNSNDMFKTLDAFNDVTPLRTFGGYPTNPESFDLPGVTSQTSTNESPSLSTYGGFQPNLGNDMPVADNGASHIRAPELANPALFMQPRPFLTPMMNPALMMNPLMMQQQMMMMSNHHFFLQQLAQMEMYYKAMGMPATPGMTTLPQAMPAPAFNAQNFQGFNSENMHEPHNVASDPIEPIPPQIHRPTNQIPVMDPNQLTNQIPGMEPNQPQNVPPPTTEQPASEPFWFEDYISSDPVIPPPVPSSTPRIPVNPVNRIPVNPDNLPGAFSSMSLQGKETPAPNVTNQGLSKEPNPNQPAPSQSPVLDGWGSIDCDEGSEASSGWNDSVDGWGGSNTTQSTRNASRNVSENRANVRQPTSRPHLRRHKS